MYTLLAEGRMYEHVYHVLRMAMWGLELPCDNTPSLPIDRTMQLLAPTPCPELNEQINKGSFSRSALAQLGSRISGRLLQLGLHDDVAVEEQTQLVTRLLQRVFQQPSAAEDTAVAMRRFITVSWLDCGCADGPLSDNGTLTAAVFYTKPLPALFLMLILPMRHALPALVATLLLQIYELDRANDSPLLGVLPPYHPGMEKGLPVSVLHCSDRLADQAFVRSYDKREP
jgi:hypothetical protein